MPSTMPRDFAHNCSQMMCAHDTRACARVYVQLLTHNMLMSPGTRNGFPLEIEVEAMETEEVDYNPDFIARMVEKLEDPEVVTLAAPVQPRSRDLNGVSVLSEGKKEKSG